MSISRQLAFAVAMLAMTALVPAQDNRHAKPNPDQPAGQPAAPSAGWRDQLDPQMKAVLAELARLNPKPIESLSPEEARRQPTIGQAAMAVLKAQKRPTDPEPVGDVDNRDINGPDGDIDIRVYTPEGDGPFPVVVFYHGGGWVIADLDSYDPSARALCNAARCVVVSSHYRQAPEHKFPAAVDDAFAAYEWTVKNADSIKGDPRRIAVAGESAGGNMATVVCMMARDKGIAMPVCQLLIYPVTQMNRETETYKQYADAVPLSKAMMGWFAGHYLNGTQDAANPKASPLDSADLSGLPPATIITAQIDPLRAEGEQYAEKLKEAGVPVRYRNFNGVTHEFFGMGAVLDQAKKAVAFAAEGLRESFVAPGRP